MPNFSGSKPEGDSSLDFGGSELQTDSFLTGFLIGLALNIAGFIILWFIFNSLVPCPGCIFSLYPFIGMPLIDVVLLLVLLGLGRWRMAVGIVVAVFALVGVAITLLMSR